MKIETLSEADWLALHHSRDHVSASQVSSILNMNKWSNAYTLWAQKMGYQPWPKESFLMKMGHLAEDAIAEVYTKETGRVCTDHGDYAICRHPDHPWLYCTLDRTATRHGGEEGCIELKLTTISDYWNEDDRAPLMYQIQNQIQMQCTGLAWGAVVGQVGRTYEAFHNYEAERDDEFFEATIPKLIEFRKLCINGHPPEAIEFFEEYAAIMGRIHPDDSGDTIVLSDEQVECARQYTINNAEMRELKRQNEWYKFRIQREMQGATFADCGNDDIIKWKTRADGAKVMTIKVTTEKTND